MQFFRKSFVFFMLLCLAFCLQSQTVTKEKYIRAAIGFWNVENLYDTLNDQWKNDEDFTASGIYKWTGDRYRKKIIHLSEAISQMATDATPDGLAIMGLCEVENKSVVTDLVNAPALIKRGYKVVHIEGPDARGVDPSFIYNPTYFKVIKAVSYRVYLLPDSSHRTRDILVVSGNFLGEKLSVLVNHWPSRRAGAQQSNGNRISAAKVVRRIVDSIHTLTPDGKTLVMGDFNDDPVNESIKQTIGTVGEIKEMKKGFYYNPMENLYREGIGTLAWQDSWNLFDQILLNQNWLNGQLTSWQYSTVRVFNKEFLKNDYGRYKGYPARTFSGTHYTGGYSDHFPVYILVTKLHQ